MDQQLLSAMQWILMVVLAYAAFAYKMKANKYQRKYTFLRRVMLDYVDIEKRSKNGSGERWLAFRSTLIGWLEESDKQ